MLVVADKKDGSLIIDLPSKAKEFEREAQMVLYQEFAFEEVNKSTVEKMNLFLVKWLKEKGVEVLLEDTNEN